MNADGTPAEVPRELIDDVAHQSGQSSGETPSSTPAPSPVEKIIGTDDREHLTNTTDHPNSAIVYMHTESGEQVCTGWLVSPDTVVTAGHCVYGDDGWNFQIRYSPGANGTERPYGTAQASVLWTSQQWVDDRDEGSDWGIVKLDRPFPEAGYFGLKWQTDRYDGTEVQLRGYPGEKSPGELWGMGGRVTGSPTQKLYYQMDTTSGQSGSPVFLAENNQSIAIHTGSLGLFPYNRATRITESLYNLIVGLK